MSAPDRWPDESDERYFDRLNAMSYPNSWNYISAPTRLPNELDAAFAARLTAFDAGMRGARERALMAKLATLKREEGARWEQAPQVLLVEARRDRLIKSGGQEWSQTEFHVVKRLRGAERGRSVTLRYPAYPGTSCGPYYPSFPAGTRLVIFANPGPLSVEQMIGFYDRQSAQDERTREALGLTPNAPKP
jgi:hypothetical protein